MRTLGKFLGLLLVLSLSACGYSVPGQGDAWVGGDARMVYVELFDNQTAQPYLENYLTEALVRELSRSRLFELTEQRERADLKLVGSITRFDSRALAHGIGDRITSYRASMQASARLVRTTGGEVVWQDRLQRSEDYLAAVDKSLQLDAESVAARQVASRLAEDLHAALLNSF